jgi:arylsulfatase A-like enzyme
VAHYPIQAPAAYQRRPHIASIDVPHRMVYHAQVEFLDEQLGNLTDMFAAKGMWNQTLMVRLHHAHVAAGCRKLESRPHLLPVCVRWSGADCPASCARAASGTNQRQRWLHEGPRRMH